MQINKLSSTCMMYYSNADRRLGFNIRNTTSPLPPLAMEHMEPPYTGNGLSNLYASGTGSHWHLPLDDSATGSSDGVSGPFSSNSNSLGNVSLQPFFSELFV